MSDKRIIVVERNHRRAGRRRMGVQPRRHQTPRVPDPFGSAGWNRADDRMEIDQEKPARMAGKAIGTRCRSRASCRLRHRLHPDGCEICLKYRYRNGAWVEQALPEEFAQRPVNLSIRVRMNMPKFASLPDQRKGNAEPGYRLTLRNIGPRRRICE